MKEPSATTRRAAVIPIAVRRSSSDATGVRPRKGAVIITPAECKAARKLLGWSQLTMLASRRAPSVISNAGGGSPIGSPRDTRSLRSRRRQAQSEGAVRSRQNLGDVPQCNLGRQGEEEEIENAFGDDRR
jgi:hypothetical protein